MSATRWVKTKPASLKSLESFGNGRCISNKISITDAKNTRPSEKIRGKWMLWGSLAPLQALFMLIFTHLVALIDHPEQSRLDAAKTGPKGNPRDAPRSAHPGGSPLGPIVRSSIPEETRWHATRLPVRHRIWSRSIPGCARRRSPLRSIRVCPAGCDRQCPAATASHRSARPRWRCPARRGCAMWGWRRWCKRRRARCCPACLSNCRFRWWSRCFR